MTKELYRVINRLLSENFTDIKVYGSEVTENIKKPCFFVEIGSNSNKRLTTSLKEVGRTVTITYMQEEFSSSDFYSKIDAIDDLIGIKVVTDRAVYNVTDLHHFKAGRNGELLQVEINLEAIVKIIKKESYEMMKTIHMKEEL